MEGKERKGRGEEGKEESNNHSLKCNAEQDRQAGLTRVSHARIS